MTQLPSSTKIGLAVVFTACLAACGGGSGSSGAGSGAQLQAPQISIPGNRADLISDGNARVDLLLPADANASTLKVMAGSRDVTSVFSGSGGRLSGVVSGLPAGTSTLSVSATGMQTAAIDITNTPRGGPVRSGPHVTPFFCATVTAQPATASAPATLASGLSTEAVGPECNIATEYKFFYKTTAANCSLATPDPNPPATAPANACFKPYNPAAAAPVDLATTTTDGGQTVAFIVRVERGTMNRGIYDLAVLADPTKPAATQPIWNGKVLFAYGGGGGQPRRQQRPASNWTDDDALSRGYIVGVNSMMDASLNNNRVITAETTMMMKEHIVDTYGPVKFAVGRGPSGGSISQYTIASQHPGVLDGLLILQSLLDYDTSHTESWECSQLTETYDMQPWKDAMAAAGYTQAQINAKKAAVNGHRNQLGCQAWFNSFGAARLAGNNSESKSIPAANRDSGVIVTTQLATPSNTCQLPASMVYTAGTNPGGVRCGVWDWMASIFGTTNGEGNSTRDNTGIQYGLKALRDGVLTPEEFVILNESVGGPARDGSRMTARAAGSETSMETAYRVGLVAGRNLASAAIIDLRSWDDDGVHQQWRSFGLRQRLDQANGHHANQVIWRAVSTPAATMGREALTEMDRWLTALKADTSNTPLPQKLVRAKPSTAFDYCYLSTDTAMTTKVTDQATCDADPMLKIGMSPRQVAGGPLAENILKCQLKAITPADYAPAVLTAGQISRLSAVFPRGVCDWSKPGVGQQPTGDAPFTFKAGPGGVPLGAPPAQRNL